MTRSASGGAKPDRTVQLGPTVDLPPGQTSGLAEATRLLRNVEGIGHVVYTAEDVIRHELVARIVDAYDKAALKAARSRETKE